MISRRHVGTDRRSRGRDSGGRGLGLTLGVQLGPQLGLGLSRGVEVPLGTLGTGPQLDDQLVEGGDARVKGSAQLLTLAGSVLTDTPGLVPSVCGAGLRSRRPLGRFLCVRRGSIAGGFGGVDLAVSTSLCVCDRLLSALCSVGDIAGGLGAGLVDVSGSPAGGLGGSLLGFGDPGPRVGLGLGELLTSLFVLCMRLVELRRHLLGGPVGLGAQLLGGDNAAGGLGRRGLRRGGPAFGSCPSRFHLGLGGGRVAKGEGRSSEPVRDAAQLSSHRRGLTKYLGAAEARHGHRLRYLGGGQRDAGVLGLQTLSLAPR